MEYYDRFDANPRAVENKEGQIQPRKNKLATPA
jgi:hypothetical protein